MQNGLHFSTAAQPPATIFKPHMHQLQGLISRFGWHMHGVFLENAPSVMCRVFHFDSHLGRRAYSFSSIFIIKSRVAFFPLNKFFISYDLLANFPVLRPWPREPLSALFLLSLNHSFKIKLKYKVSLIERVSISMLQRIQCNSF